MVRAADGEGIRASTASASALRDWTSHRSFRYSDLGRKDFLGDE
jgi:hypothetical protein